MAGLILLSKKYRLQMILKSGKNKILRSKTIFTCTFALLANQTSYYDDKNIIDYRRN